MGVQISKGNGQFWGLFAPQKSMGVFAAEYAKTAEPTEMSFGALTHAGSRNHLLDKGQCRTNPFAAKI